MADTRFLQKRRQGWYARVRVPPALCEFVGKQHILRSLGTRSLTEAQTRRWSVVGEIKAYLDDVRKLAEGTKRDPAATNPEALISEARVLRRQLDAGEIGPDEFDAADHARQETHLSALGKRYGIDKATGNPLAPPELEQALRLSSKITAGYAVVLMKDALRDYLAETGSRVTPQTLRQKDRRLSALLAWLGPTVELEAITKRRIGEYVTRELQTAKTPGGRPVSAKTVRDTLSDLSAFFAWAEGRGLIETNPCTGVSRTIRTDTRGKQAKRRPWTPEELSKLLSGIAPDDPLWSLVVLALFTGARLNEIAELRVENVTEEGAKIVEGKTQSSVREIPWHPAVVPIVRRLLKTSTDGYLISGLNSGGQNDRRGFYASKRFGNVCDRLRLSDPAINFHTLRNTFITAAETAGIPQITAQRLAGHKPQSITFGTYSGGPEFQGLKKAVRSLTFGADVDKLVRALGKKAANKPAVRPKRRRRII